MIVSVFGRNVDLPPLDLPLPPGNDDQPVSLTVRVEDSDQSLPPGTPHSIDELVSLVAGAPHLHEPMVVSLIPHRPLGPRTIEHYVVDHAVPTGLTISGDLVLHAAAVQAPNGDGIVLSGPSGAGKSTTSACMAGSGWRVLGDDGVRLGIDDGQVRMWGSYPGIRLHEDVSAEMTGSLGSGGLESGGLVAEYATKRRFVPSQPTDSAEAVASYFIELGDDATLTLEELGSATICGRLAENMFFPPAGPADALRRLELASPLAERLAGYRLSFPRTTSGVDDAVRALSALVS